MKRSSRIHSLKHLASRHEQQAVRLLGQSKKFLLDQQNRLNELCSYRQEYQARFQDQGVNGMMGSQLLAYQSFIRQLDEAIALQKTQVIEAEKQCLNETNRWREKHMKTQALDKTMQRFVKQEHEREEKKRQREMDDFINFRLHVETE